MQILFGRSYTVGSALIRLGTWSVWGHCGIVTPEGTVIEARWGGGVVERPMAKVLAGMSAHHVLEVACPDDAAGLAWARSTLGARYDWRGVFGLAIRRRWDQDDAWFCSEHVEAALAAAGRRRWRQPWRVTPQHSWMVV